MFTILFGLAQQFTGVLGMIWDWLFVEVTIMGNTYSPIAIVFGPGILALATVSLIKGFNPLS